MQILQNLREHNFIKTLSADSIIISKEKIFKISDIHLPQNIDFTEWEYFIHNTGFYTMNLLHLCNQINSGFEYIANYNYKDKKSTSKRIEHLEYNIENYIIRLASVKDRTLQVVNAVFHLGIDEANVSENVIVSNIKVRQTKIPAIFNKLTKTIKKYSGDRNTIIHRHTYLNTEIRKLHIFYSDYIIAGIVENKLDKNIYKEFRKNRLKEYLQEKKKEIITANEAIFAILFDLFTLLELKYNQVKKTLE